jgi:hypothetical protein
MKQEQKRRSKERKAGAKKKNLLQTAVHNEKESRFVIAVPFLNSLSVFACSKHGG